MFSRLAIATALATLVVASPWDTPTTTATKTVTETVTAPAPTVTTAGQCNTGDAQCCQSTESASSAAGSQLLGLLGIVLEDADVLLGLDCSPLDVVGVGSGSECNAEPVCCTENGIGDLISIGCVPISL
ncbi:fungal hydrophobin [Wolfiporia cocos MD-104 SS10]|uniref:Hydrophobin n=1 Tax=Wolfiporia cocos (strain MD-104) TaxID=742152 RepID=A0A2H3J9Q1_WOLCO|nr:fungal hydrophobin [Wolfiporia cocos MD-104 SS10]